MKHFLTLLILLPAALQAQFALRSALNLPRTDDLLVKQQVEYKNPGRDGQNVVWDFSQLQTVNDEYQVRYFTPSLVGDTVYIMGLDTLHIDSVAPLDDNPAPLFVSLEHYTQYYHRFDGNTLYTIGYENPSNIVKYTEPLLEAFFPAQFGDKRQVLYAAQGISSQSTPIETQGKVSLEVDAEGCIILPSGDTVNHVMRLKHRQTINQQVLNPETNQFANQLTIVKTYRWFAQGYRYPIFETIILNKVASENTDEGQNIFGTAFFYPPQEHYYLADDAQNLAVLDSIQTADADPWANLKYNYFPNPLEYQLNIELLLPMEAETHIHIHSSLGAAVANQSFGRLPEGFNAITVSLPPLTTGNYTLNIFLNEHKISANLLKK